MRKAETWKHSQWLRFIVALFWAAGSAASARAADIYLNGASGDDGNDGLTAGTAVKTFASAKMKLASQGAGIIKVTGQVTISSDTVLSFSDVGDGVSIGWPEAMVQRDATYSNYLFRLSNSSRLTLTNIVVDGNRDKVSALSAMIGVFGNASTALQIQQGTVLRNNFVSNQTSTAGGAVQCDFSGGVSLLMSGGLITNNATLGYGGGVGFSSSHFAAKLEMTGGTISGNTAGSGGGIGFFNTTNRVSLSGTAIVAGNVAGSGGGVASYSAGAPVVEMSGDAMVSNNVTTAGLCGGVGCTFLWMRDRARICGNFANREGGGAQALHLVMTDDAAICDNVTSNKNGTGSYGAGAGVWVNGNGSAVLSGNAAVRGNTIKTPNTSGGGIHCDAGATLTTSNSVSICGNTATGEGGGIYMKSGTGWLSLNGGSVSSNKAGNAGGISFACANATVESRIAGTVIEGNQTAATGNGGGCFVSAVAGRLYFDGVRFVGNSAGNWGERGGGAINVSPGSVVCSNCVFSDNSTLGRGGAVNCYSTTSNSVFGCCVFRDNVAKGYGGAVYATANPVLFEDCLFHGNASTNGYGGAVGLGDFALKYDSSALTARRCLFAGNTSILGYGGALYLCSTSGLAHAVENCTLFGNVARYGAAVCASGARSGETALRFCTVRGNTNLSSSAAIVQTGGAPVSLSGTAVAYNYYGAAVADVSGTFQAADHCYFTQSSNTVTITSAADNRYLETSGDPMLASSPADNGGTLMPDGTRMLTLAFAKSSPLRDKGGNADGINTDARGAGYLRVQESAADIGAFEYKPDSRGTLVRIE
ncbi:MAG: choice-of-anchor Q domain-containing protein [Kiritimatiellia bacterium]|jgi:predicted outer membrane repeat protein|nr:choice-of-anchor Q domain-containing protein [Kiritimatiellia bacterium]